MASTIITCKCKNEYQDATHGKNQRVANLDKNGNPRCTVCCPTRKSKRQLLA